MTLVLVALSFGARLSWRMKGLTGLLFALMLIQAVIPYPPLPAWMSALHGVNALLLVALTVYLGVRNWAFRGAPRPLPSQG
jgi:hypothetical protein